MKLSFAVLAVSYGAARADPLLRSKQKELLRATADKVALGVAGPCDDCAGDPPNYRCAGHVAGKVKYGCERGGRGCSYLSEGEEYPFNGFCTYRETGDAAPTPSGNPPPAPTPAACTGDGSDMWSSGSEVPCCAGLEKTLSDDYRWVCHPGNAGGNDDDAPTTPNPPPPDAPSPWDGQKFGVLSGNHFWWNLMRDRRGNNQSMGRLYRSHLDAGKAIHLGGFQECEDIGVIMRDAQMEGTHAYRQFGGALAVAWDRSVFGDDVVAAASPECERVAHDRPEQDYGWRLLCWVRLRHRGSGRLVTFATTHGPLPVNTGGRDGPEAYVDEIMKVVNRIVPDDADDATFLMVGDFNNTPNSRAIRGLSERLDAVPEDHPPGFDVDFHYTSRGAYKSGSGESIGDGGSDHPQMWADIELN